MGSFLGGLGTLLGGWNVARRIDEEGFDWEEKQRQAELARQQQQTEWQQRNEAEATKALAEASITAPEGTDYASLVPEYIKKEDVRRRVLARGPGVAAQARSNIEAGKQASAEYIANQRLEAQKEALRNTQEFQQAMQAERLEAARQGRQASEDNAWRRLGFVQNQVNRRWSMMPTQIPTGYDQYGQPTYTYVPRESVVGQPFAKPNLPEQALRTTTEVTQQAMANNLDTLQRQLEEVKKYSGTTALTSPVDAYNARQTYKATLQNLAIQLNRVTGDTSGRYSDVDREVAAQMLGVLNDPILIGDPDMAQKRLDEARMTIAKMGQIQKQLRPRAPSGASTVVPGTVPPPTTTAPPIEVTSRQDVGKVPVGSTFMFRGKLYRKNGPGSYDEVSNAPQ